MNVDKNRKIVDQDTALHGFLDSLLTEVSDTQKDQKKPMDDLPVRLADIEEVIPDWAKSPFKGMLCKIGDVTLVLPVEKINCILPWSDDITSTNIMNAWILGEICHRTSPVKIIDTQKFISASNTTKHSPTNIILTEGRRYGLACHGIGDVVELESDQIRWRRGQTGKPWYRGIVTGLRCTLLDIDIVVNAVERGCL